MRPVLLEIDGFASYRTKTTVDFRGADFFVLVGPTGAGKSTVIDAMVFALYGTVPRWGDRSAVAPALAPTVNRGVVRLIFEVGGKRYTAVRDVRRGGGKTQAVSVREARLEQYRSADATGGPDDETISLESGSPKVTRAVEALLGLNFDQFIQSVALPQGEFARFLHATDAERQAILKNLLGYGIYDDIGRAANSRAGDNQLRAEMLTEQLAGYADATQDHLDTLTVKLKELSDFQDRLTADQLPALRKANSDADGARARLEQLTAERNDLLAVVAPAGLDDLAEGQSAARDVLRSTEEHQRAAEEQDGQARAALQSARPRHELVQVERHWTELDRICTEMPALADQVTATGTALEQAQQNRDQTAAALEQLRTSAGEANRVAESEQRRLAELDSRLRALHAVRAPGDLDSIAQAVRAAGEQHALARARLDDAEADQKAAADALELLPDPGVTGSAVDAARHLVDLLSADLEAEPGRVDLRRSAAGADAEVARTAAQVAAAELALHDAERADRAAAIRAELHVGDDCPVCGVVIAELPDRDLDKDLEKDLDRNLDHDLGQLHAQLAQAKSAAESASATASRLAAQCGSDDAVRRQRLRDADGLRQRLATSLTELGFADQSAALARPIAESAAAAALVALSDDIASAQQILVSIQQRRSAAETTRRAADAAVASARERFRAADGAAQRATAQSASARASLREARDALSALAPPPIDDSDVQAAWTELTAWTQDRSVSLATEVAEQSAAASTAAARAATLRDELACAQTAAAAAEDSFRTSALERQRADDRWQSALRSKDELTELLAGEPGLDEVRTELQRVIALQGAVDAASAALTTARAASTAARVALDEADAAVRQSYQELRRTRDPLTRFGAPEIGGTDLAADWRAMADWSAAEAASRLAESGSARQLATAADERARHAERELIRALAERGIPLPPEVVGPALLTEAPTATAAAVASASAAVARAAERLQESETMVAQLRHATEDASVAKTLANLMRANQFPRWLISSALDALLDDASKILFELSGGQFELTRDERDLLVVDHNDADMCRLVKTLSGGETFQASLALALALSEQVTALSAAGANKLESIFLDEGFGTLDDATLDVVAGTLENLASSGSRMVGVITHVGALAERIPVRFRVARDNTGSHVEREQL